VLVQPEPPGRTVWAVSVTVLVAAATFGCSTASVLPPQEVPVLESLGSGVVRYGGPVAWVVVDYRFARLDTGEPWLVLDVGVTAADGQRATISRSEIFVRSPSGGRYPLATQQAYRRAHVELANLSRRANVVASASYDFPGSRTPCRFNFFVPQSERRQVAFDEVYVNDNRACFERFYFHVPDGVDAGRWVLGIDLDESQVRVPFDL
jgi:hypothetical protein